MRHRPLLLIGLLAVSAAVPAVVNASAATGSPRSRAPFRRSLPAIAGKAVTGDVLRAWPGRWRGARTLRYRWERCNPAGARCTVIDRTGSHRPYGGRTYRLRAMDVGHRIRVTVRAANAQGTRTATSRPTAVVVTPGTAGTNRSGPGQIQTGSGTGTGLGSGVGATGGATTPTNYFATVASSQNGLPPAGIPRPDATCAAQVIPALENRPQNSSANHTVPSNPSSITWSPGLDYWTNFVTDRNQITGDFMGTTDEILQWVACKWGIDVNIVRADAVVESDWVQSTVGDNCGVAGEASYGILQVKNKDCSGNSVHGGWPYTQNDTALDADYWGARLRACFDGAFYDGGPWLYDGQTIAQVIAAHGQDYALWGCIGSWFSGNWYDSGAQGYIAKVQGYYQSKPWLQPGF